jgi:phage I-like protein
VTPHAESIVIDYDHEGDVGRSTRAAGWFTGQAEVRDTDDGPRLYAEVDWTPRARQEIRDGEYRKFSPVFDFAKKDKKSGFMTKAKQIVAGTLTNRPFFTELTPVLAADVVWEPEQGLQYLRDKCLLGAEPRAARQREVLGRRHLDRRRPRTRAGVRRRPHLGRAVHARRR